MAYNIGFGMWVLKYFEKIDGWDPENTSDSEKRGIDHSHLHHDTLDVLHPCRSSLLDIWDPMSVLLITFGIMFKSCTGLMMVMLQT
jgi:hypothetical protein